MFDVLTDWTLSNLFILNYLTQNTIFPDILISKTTVKFFLVDINIHPVNIKIKICSVAPYFESSHEQFTLACLGGSDYENSLIHIRSKVVSQGSYDLGGFKNELWRWRGNWILLYFLFNENLIEDFERERFIVFTLKECVNKCVCFGLVFWSEICAKHPSKWVCYQLSFCHLDRLLFECNDIVNTVKKVIDYSIVEGWSSEYFLRSGIHLSYHIL